jgi:hypothetical protein
MSESLQAVVANVVENAKAPESAPQTEPTQPILPEKKPEDDFSSKFAALSRREKGLLEKERKIKAMEEELNGRSGKVNSWEERVKGLKQNPAAFDDLLSEAGISFEDYLNNKLGIQSEEKQLTPDEMYKKLKEEMEGNFKKLEEEKKQQIEAQNAQTIDNFKTEVSDFITTNADKYELINYQGDFDLVYNVVEEYFHKEGEILSIQDAADLVEKHLEEIVDGANKLKKIASKFAPKVEVQPKLEVAPKPEAVREPKISPTLSNDLNSKSSTSSNPTVSIEESKKRAAQLLRWN